METKIKVRSFDSSLSPEAFNEIPRRPVYAILDNLRSAFNVGSIVRTADCALIEKIYFCGITAHPPHKKLDKTAATSTMHKKTAARKKSRLAKKLNAIKTKKE